MRNTLKINQFGKHCLVPLRNDFFVQNRHSGPQKRPLWPFFTKKWPADGTNGQMSQIWSDQKLPQDISKLWSHWFGSFRLKKMHFHNSSVKKCRFWPKIEPKITKFVHFLLMLAHFILSLLYFEWCKLIRWLLVPAASHGCQNMTKEPVLVIFWSNLCNQYRGLPRQILPFIWVKNMFFRLVSASLGQKS